MGLTQDDIRNGLLLFILLIGCLCLRAYGQAWLANRLGDPTPDAAGRLTMNPLPHLDLIGSVVLPLICIFYLMPRFAGMMLFLAWTKPVPINPANFAKPSRDHLLTQLMNPGMSVLVGIAAAIAGGLLYRSYPESSEVFTRLILINASLIVLDFLPIPPLPGGMLLRFFGIISEATFWNVARWGGLILIVLLNIPAFQVIFGRLMLLIATPFLIIQSLVVR
jgi:Zn-dependent protease